MINPSNAKLNPICHLLALLRVHPILHVSRIRVNYQLTFIQCCGHPYPILEVQIVIQQIRLNTNSSIIVPLESDSTDNLYKQALDCIILSVR